MKGLLESLKGRGGRIFIRYRRRDSTWFVGRLYDSLSRYFGDQRVFRDVGDIQGGADFHVVLEETLGSADALIAVIGPEWLTATDQEGNSALGAPNDWLTQEICTALDRGIPVYPVLLDDAQMPRADELPESLRRLARFNAVSIGDDRWDADVTRLANIVGLDIPSANERQLNFWNRLATAALVGAVWLTMGLVAARYLDSQQWFYFSDASTCGSPTFGLIEKWQSGLVYLAIVPCVVLFFVVAAPGRPSEAALPAGSRLGGRHRRRCGVRAVPANLRQLRGPGAVFARRAIADHRTRPHEPVRLHAEVSRRAVLDESGAGHVTNKNRRSSIMFRTLVLVIASSCDAASVTSRRRTSRREVAGASG